MNSSVKRWPLFLFLVFFSLTLILFDKLGFLAYAKSGLEKIFLPFEVRFYQVNKRVETDFGSQQQVELEAEILNLKKENNDFRRLLGAPLPSSWHFTPAQVIGNDNGILLIDKGKEDGVLIGQAVIYDNFLVGKITETGENISRLQTPTSPGFKLSVVVKSPKSDDLAARGLVLVQGGRLILDQVLMEEKIAVGDIVMTALDRYIPADLPIGTVTNLVKPTSVFQKAEIEPALASFQLKNVFLITYK